MEVWCADLRRSQDERDALQAELAKLQQSASTQQPKVSQGEAESAASKLQIQRNELTLDMSDIRDHGTPGQKPRHETLQLHGDLRGKDALLHYCKRELQEYVKSALDPTHASASLETVILLSSATQSFASSTSWMTDHNATLLCEIVLRWQ